MTASLRTSHFTRLLLFADLVDASFKFRDFGLQRFHLVVQPGSRNESSRNINARSGREQHKEPVERLQLPWGERFRRSALLGSTFGCVVGFTHESHHGACRRWAGGSMVSVVGKSGVFRTEIAQCPSRCG